ncbi:putative transcription factor jumonji aspartyl beta-hydroxylase protein [Neofusicoccum parvum]|uniref:Transcription factor jumonji aspartyl beta-hydroxylase protein n=1 Tax=Neofusicoccum parvum TaxID=310453 RepID=A0ACB5SNX8_9PEZI|nr:putative transcription factor jumonji aspartyl beta-hydroxylase protein [Neofusicoccum parvum]
MAIGRNPARPAVHAELPALRGILTQTAARAAHLSSPVAWASVADLVAAKKQARQLKRAVCALTRRVNSLLAAIGEEEQRRSHQSTPTSSTLAPPPPPPPVRCRDGGERGRYAGRVPFGLAQMGAAFVPTIHQVLADFPAGRSLGYCKIRVGDDARRGVDCARMAGYSVGDLEGHQSAAVGLEEWSGPAALAGMVCSIFTAPDAGDDEEIRRHGFVFPDMEAAEAAAPQLHGYELFCATVEGACAADKKPYLVIPSECTSEWRRSAGLPQEPCIDCGSRLRQTAGRIAGVHTPYEYISSAAQSGTGMHVEDAMLGSANIVLAGAPKVWLIVPPDNLDALEAKMEKLGDSLRPIQPCSQFVRHLDALLSPRLLEKWGIEYDIVTCRAGEMVVTLPGAYHQVLNAGPNYAQAINFAMPDWSGPPEGYRFCCEEEYTNPNAPKAEHFRVLGCGETGDEEESSEGSRESEAEVEVEGREDVDEQPEEIEQEGGELDDERREETEEDMEDDPDRESEEEKEEQVGSSETEDKNLNKDTVKCQQGVPGANSIDVLSTALVRQRASDVYTARSNAFKALSNHVTTVLTNPRKRYALPLVETAESGCSESEESNCSDDDDDDCDDDDHSSDNGPECANCAECAVSSGGGAFITKDDDRSFDVQIRGPAAVDAISLRRPTTMQQSGISRWSDCVLHTARHRGFNAEAVLKAFHNAPEDQPIVKVLRTLQCICEVANIPLLLQLRRHLLANPKGTAPPTTAPDISKENSEDIGALVRIHQNISTLRTISWITQYELATHQLEYYQQFEAVVKTRKADTKKATDERRNLQTQVAVKEEIVAMMTKQGMSELAAKDELEQYLKHGTSDSNSSSLVPK